MKKTGSAKLYQLLTMALVSLMLMATQAFAQVATPTMNPVGGTYTEIQSVTLHCNTSGAIIYYTTNNTTPTTSSSVYSSPITVNNQNPYLKAIAVKAGDTDSSVASATYIIRVGQPSFSPSSGGYFTEGTDMDITVTSSTSGATLRYTTDGSDPTSSSPILTSPLTIYDTTTLKVQGFKTNMNNSNIMTSYYYEKLRQPNFSPAGGTYSQAQMVTIDTDNTVTPNIYYTRDGSTPTSSSSIYFGSIEVRSSQTIKAVALAGGYLDSNIITQVYTLPASVETPKANPPRGYNNQTYNVTLSCATSGATIYYTLDGSTPSSTNGTLYTSSIQNVSNQEIKMIAYKSGMVNSLVSSASFKNTHKRIGAGQFHSLAIANDGIVFAWGDNSYYQLGNGTDTDSTVPVPVSNLTDIVTVASSWNHSLALKSDGTVYAWGMNDFGQLGIDDTADHATPVQVITDADTTLNNVVAIATGYSHSLALTSDGKVWAWGNNYAGQLGDGTTQDIYKAKQVPNFDGIKEISANWATSFAVKNDGTLWAWGYGNDASLCSGPGYGNKYVPTQAWDIHGDTSTYLRNVDSVSAGNEHTLVKLSDGTLVAAGRYDFGQLGNPSYPMYISLKTYYVVDVIGIVDADEISTGYAFNVALLNDGTVQSWGYNGSSELGNNDTTSTYYIQDVLEQVSPQVVLNDVVSIVTGVHHSLAVKSNGEIWAWGPNNDGQYGNGSTTSSTIAVQVLDLDEL